ncbi:MAG: hypothetical protein LBR22_03765 [Desulfovibrio sp.]|jgi:hypothetical protein|nr:hypothetical protein [Desulfovibrio sp.]
MTDDVDFSTNDDVYTQRFIYSMSKLIAKKYGWKDNWFNNCFDSFYVTLHSKKLSILQNSEDDEYGLFIDVVVEDQLLALKCDALRKGQGRHDYEDAIFLMQETGIISREDLLENMRKYFGDQYMNKDTKIHGKIDNLLDCLAEWGAMSAQPPDDTEAAAMWFLDQGVLDPRTKEQVFEKIWGVNAGPKIRNTLSALLGAYREKEIDINAATEWAKQFHVGFQKVLRPTQAGHREDVVFDDF